MSSGNLIKMARVAALCACGSLVFAFAAPVQGAEAGQWQSISDANLAWQPFEQQQTILAALARLPAAWYRDALHPNAIDRQVSLLRQIRAQQKRVLLIINPEPEEYTTPDPVRYGGEEFNKLCGWASGNVSLSRIDRTRLKHQLRMDLGKLTGAGVVVDAFEIGNELDWVCFNTDLPIAGEGNVPDHNLRPIAEAYASFLEASVDVIKEFYPGALIVSFGIGNTMERIPAHAVAHPAQLIRMIGDLDRIKHFDLIDRIGMHVYPDPKSPETIGPMLQKFVLEGHVKKPLWITEWGYHNSFFPPDNGKARLSSFREFRDAIQQSGTPVQNMFLFSIASSDDTLLDKHGNLLPEAQYFNDAPQP